MKKNTIKSRARKRNIYEKRNCSKIKFLFLQKHTLASRLCITTKLSAGSYTEYTTDLTPVVKRIKCILYEVCFFPQEKCKFEMLSHPCWTVLLPRYTHKSCKSHLLQFHHKTFAYMETNSTCLLVYSRQNVTIVL